MRQILCQIYSDIFNVFNAGFVLFENYFQKICANLL